MIYLFYGTDQTKAREKFRRVMETFRAKQRSGQIHRFGVDDFDRARFEELAGASSLFGEKCLLAGENILSLLSLSSLTDSRSTLIFLEEKADVNLLREFKKIGGQVEEFRAARRSDNRPAFNVFSLVNAVAAGQRQRAWMLYQQALAAHLAPEQIFWPLCWKAKTAGLKFLSGALVDLWHQARRGQCDFEIGLERILLSI